MLDKVKKHFIKRKELYVGFGVGVGIAGITYLIVRDYSQTNIKHSTSVLAKGSTSIFGKNLTLNNVSYFSANRQGPPSWVVRCLETGEVFTSQREAALMMGLSASRLSNHLNGSRNHINGYHFERICMAA